MTEQKKLIIDTDIGDDIDDAFAILLSMKLKHEIVGITTVLGNTAARGKIAKRLLTEYGNGYENTPVYCGYSGDFDPSSDPSYLSQYTNELDNDIYAPVSENSEDAIDFIIESCYKYGRSLTIVAIGPLTNIARVIKKDKNALALAGEVVLMGGAYFSQYADWNVSCDPEAARCVFEGASSVTAIGADVTHTLTLPKSIDKIISEYSGKNGGVIYVRKLYKAWKNATKKELAVLHDPLAVCVANNNDVCSYLTSPVAVVTDGYARALTISTIEYKKAFMNTAYRGFDFSANHKLAKTVKTNVIFGQFKKCFQ